MKRKFMLSMLLVLSFALASCQGTVDDSVICDSDEILVDGWCTDDPFECRETESDKNCYMISDGECGEIVISCPVDTIYEDCNCVPETVICEEGYREEDGECVEINCVPGYVIIDGVCTLEEDSNGYRTFNYDGLDRQYLLYIPEDLDPDAPLVFALHGFTGNPIGIQYLTHFNEIADREGFAVVYPYGTLVEGISHWDAGLDYAEVDDVGFLVALAVYLQETHNLSTDNTFITGFSNGGFMSYEVACEASDTFKAAAPVAGLMSPAVYDACEGNPMPILHIHGAVDRVVPINAEMSVSGGWGGGPDTDGIIEYWNTVNGNSIVEDYELGTTSIDKYSGGTYPVWYYLVSDYDHIWPGSIDYYSPVAAETAGFDASEVIWEFFSQFID